MIVVKTIAEIGRHLKAHQSEPLGLVPTMGALHKGHVSLVTNAINKCPVIVVSIYVNPAQFNDRNDLRNYPRTMDPDLALLGKTLRGKDIVFTPDDHEIYPVPDNREFNFGNAGRVMEALYRPGHFNGVARVVSRLFDIVRPNMAFFGMKDFQQVAIVKELVKQNNYKIKIVENPIIREPDGLAMSSRNSLLEPEIRKKAPVIYQTISQAAGMLTEYDIEEIQNFIFTTIENEQGFKVEYFEIVDDHLLIPVNHKSEMKEDLRYFGCIAVKAGRIRLIDNIEFCLPLIKKVN